MANISEINGYGIYAQTASLATTASYALTASYVEGGGEVSSNVLLFAGSFNGDSVSAGTRYYSLAGGTDLSSPGNRYIATTRSGTLKNWYWVHGAVTTQDVTLYLYLNGSATTMSIFIPAGSGAGAYYDTGSNIAVSAGDLICAQVVSATAPNLLSAGSTIELEFTP